LRQKISFRALFWATGGIAFCLSPFADNLTTALLMATVALKIGNGNTKFIVPALINIVVAANAGGVWSPFGDITTLMVWTAGKVSTHQFAYLFLPSLANWVVPAVIMHGFIPRELPQGSDERIALLPGARTAIFLGLLTITIAVSFHHFLHLPPFLGMMLGLGLLMVLAYCITQWGEHANGNDNPNDLPHFDLFLRIASIEFDTLLFFFGVLMAVGALQYVGYLALVSHGLYGTLGPTGANIAIGLFSAVIDNIPLMFAVLKMNPDMGLDQWLLVTLTAGVGGSLLSIGSAAGVAAMGVAPKDYTFLAHLRWAPAIAMGYLAAIATWWLTIPNLTD
jgi:Na+/H+ antiporter NhaD/arsenite permease-like protein